MSDAGKYALHGADYKDDELVNAQRMNEDYQGTSRMTHSAYGALEWGDKPQSMPEGSDRSLGPRELKLTAKGLAYCIDRKVKVMNTLFLNLRRMSVRVQ